jgi:MFS family permease
MSPQISTPAGQADGRSPNAWPTLCACFFGYMLNAMDVLMFEPAMLAMLKADDAFKLTKHEAVAITTAAFLTSAAGGWLAGRLSDRFSRVRTLEWMIAVFAVATFMCGFANLPGFTPGYGWLFFWRAVMGIGWGGQWAAAAVLVGEAFGSADRGRAVGIMQSAWALGWAAAFFVIPPLAQDIAALLQPILPPKAGWRMIFWLGLSPVLLIPFVHWRVGESSVIVETRKRLAATGRKAGTLALFSPNMLSTTVLTCVLSIGSLCGYWAIILWLPVSLDVQENANYYRLLIAGAFAGYVFSALLSDVGHVGRPGNLAVFAIVLTGFMVLWQMMPVPADPSHVDWSQMNSTQADKFLMDMAAFRMEKAVNDWFLAVVAGASAAYLISALIGYDDLFGRRRNFMIFALFAIVTVFTCLRFKANPQIILWLAFPLGFFASGAFSGIGAFFAELFPTSVRAMGVGFTYNFGRGFAILILWLIPVQAGEKKWELLGSSIGLFVLISYGLMIVATLLLRENEDRVLCPDGGEAYDTATPRNAPPPRG